MLLLCYVFNLGCIHLPEHLLFDTFNIIIQSFSLHLHTLHIIIHGSVHVITHVIPHNGRGASIPTFIGGHYYCESGFIVSPEQRVAWEDPLWDGNGCHTPNNTCCDRSGFFYRNVTTSTDDIEVRWCSNVGYPSEDMPTDQLEIWVM